MGQPAFQILAPCPYCEADAGQPCETNSGYEAEVVHQSRIKASKEWQRKEEAMQPGFPANKIKLALWYIEECGGKDNAVRYLERALGALGEGTEKVRVLLERKSVRMSLIDPDDGPPGISFVYKDKEGKRWHTSLLLTPQD